MLKDAAYRTVKATEQTDRAAHSTLPQMPNPSVSVIILTKNESANITACIQSTHGFATEVLVIDGQSSDNTRELAAAAGARVVEFTDWQGWGHKRQQAQQAACGSYILHLDADERLTPSLIAELTQALQQAKGNEIFALARCNHLFGERIAHCGWSPDYVLRCYRTDYTSFNDAKVHEHVIVPPDGKVVYLKSPLIHYTYQSVGQCLGKQLNYALHFAEEKHSRGKSVALWSIPLRGLFTFIRVYFLRRGFLDGRWGLWNAISSASYTINKYLALYAKAHGKRLR